MAHTAVFGIDGSRQDAEMAIESMRSAGFRATDISVLFPENEGTKDIGHEKHTKAPEKAAAGAAIAGGAGAALGWLVGIGALAIPGVGPFLAAGPIMAALAGLGAGSVVGGLAGALVGAGIPEYEAKRYEGRIRSGGILLSVHCEDDLLVSRAKQLLKHTGAEDIAAAEEARVAGGPRRDVEEVRVPVEPAPVRTVPVEPAFHSTSVYHEPLRAPDSAVPVDHMPIPEPDVADTRRIRVEPSSRILPDEDRRTSADSDRRTRVEPPPPTELL